MQVIPTEIPDVKIIEPRVFKDDRGYFFESFRLIFFNEAFPSANPFIQENESKSSRGVLRGLHYQLPPFAQAKLVRVISGSVLDVAVDIRTNSPTFGKHVAVELSGENHKQLYIPRGFAHGFLVLSESAIFSYKVDAVYAPEYERGIAYNDPDINVNWQLPDDQLILSPKDQNAPFLKNNNELFSEALCTS